MPDVTKRLAQELVVNDKVAVLAGFGLTPLGAGDRADRHPGQDAEVVMAAATSSSPRPRRSSCAPASRCRRSTVPMADWAAKNGIKKVVTLVTDYGPGIDAEKSFTEQVQGQRRQDRREPARAAAQPRLRAVPAEGAPTPSPTRCSSSCRRAQGAQFMKQFAERGLDKARHQADRHRRRHRRRPAQRHGRRGARRRHLAPLLGRAYSRRRTRRSSRRSRRPTTACGRTSWRSAATTACT